MSRSSDYVFGLSRLSCRLLSVPFNVSQEAFAAWLPAVCPRCHQPFGPELHSRIYRMDPNRAFEIGNIGAVCEKCELEAASEDLTTTSLSSVEVPPRGKRGPKKKVRPPTAAELRKNINPGDGPPIFHVSGHGRCPIGICPICGRKSDLPPTEPCSEGCRIRKEARALHSHHRRECWGESRRLLAKRRESLKNIQRGALALEAFDADSGDKGPGQEPAEDQRPELKFEVF